MNKSLVLIIICFTFFSCIEIKNKFHNYLKFFDEKFVSHFPKKGRCIHFLMTFKSDIKNGTKLHVIKEINKEDIVALTKVSKNIKQVYRSNDKCLLITNRLKWADKIEYDSLLRKLTYSCDSFSLPIPNFYLWSRMFKSVNSNGLPDDFIIYVIDAEPGIYMKEKYCTEGLGLPRKWKNGYSKGIAVSMDRKLIIYWIEIW